MDENQTTDKKSLRTVTGRSSDWGALARDCVCFANVRGGNVLIGIEDDSDAPPSSQRIEADLPEQIQRRISELTVNVATHAQIVRAPNGGEYVVVEVLPSQSTIASTTDGRYYIRVADECQPVMPDALGRLFTDKPSYIWEVRVARVVRKSDADPEKLQQFVAEIRASDRVSDFVKQKSPEELLDYYFMAEGGVLTNLGVLWVGKRADRAQLQYAPLVQFLKYDENGNRTHRIVWDDYSLNPKELIEQVWSKIPDWKEGVEVADGLFRKFVPNYAEEIIRELIANALVHRPYTTRGDVFINLYPDRLEVHNPGLLPLGVTPENILHKTIKRNEHLAKVFYDLKLMEREGTGFDKMFEVLLGNGKQVPEVSEGDDRVIVTIRRRILKSEVVRLVSKATEEFLLRQKEIICLGLIAQHTVLSALEFSRVLNLPQQNAIRDWLGRLMDLGLVQSKGRTKGVEYFVNPEYLRAADFRGRTNLKRIEDHRLRELIIQDLRVYQDSLIAEILERVGPEIGVLKIRQQLNILIRDGIVGHRDGRKFRRYFLTSKRT